METTLELYVKQTSNCGAMPLTTFKALSPPWSGDSVTLPFGDDGRMLPVVGWTDLHFGTACQVKIAKVRQADNVGYLVYGGNSGVRILDAEADAADHLPPGYGQPIVWVEDAADLPAEVRAIVAGAHSCERCGLVLPDSASPYHLERDAVVWLCEGCASVA